MSISREALLNNTPQTIYLPVHTVDTAIEIMQPPGPARPAQPRSCLPPNSPLVSTLVCLLPVPPPSSRLPINHITPPSPPPYACIYPPIHPSIHTSQNKFIHTYIPAAVYAGGEKKNKARLGGEARERGMRGMRGGESIVLNRKAASLMSILEGDVHWLVCVPFSCIPTWYGVTGT